MKYCVKCGKEIMDDAEICPGCGCAVEVIREKKIGSETVGNGKSICAMIFGLLALTCCIISAIDGIDFLSIRYLSFQNPCYYLSDFQAFALCFIPLCELLAFTFLAAGGLKENDGTTSATAVAGLVCADGALIIFGMRVFLSFLNIGE